MFPRKGKSCRRRGVSRTALVSLSPHPLSLPLRTPSRSAVWGLFRDRKARENEINEIEEGFPVERGEELVLSASRRPPWLIDIILAAPILHPTAPPCRSDATPWLSAVLFRIMGNILREPTTFYRAHLSRSDVNLSEFLGKISVYSLVLRSVVLENGHRRQKVLGKIYVCASLCNQCGQSCERGGERGKILRAGTRWWIFLREKSF